MDFEEFLAEWHNESPTVLVYTSGSTGKPKPMYVEKRRMEASARITCQFLGLKPGDTALLCMSLDYIAGKMMVVRAQTWGLRLLSVAPSGHPLDTVAEPVDFAAMVPMQVFNSLQVPEEREILKQIKHLIIGGGAIDEALAKELVGFPNNVWSTYGMTETLSHIALRRLNGPDVSDWYTPFEGVTLSQTDEGCLVIDAPAVHDGPLVTNDIVELSEKGFRILGRKDNVICSGGIKIQIEEVERLLKQHLSAPFMITKRADRKFGEQVVLLTESMDMDAVKDICQQVLPKYWQPRSYAHIDALPMTETGKPARKVAERLAALAVEV
ncbi:AMP-binding protein [Prevotella sp. E2-28]|uniref:AMP-binding protein n=1 Tax=Prevotella sp. E2-28 TaxID=2913620 RepID=UPI001EDC6DFD|nr:AMP-binding protein [Prevotella sp. E2-28]UKK53042.1 AMP-binding protein [Prevotella sp. E2-28]